jgi:hypothetical protein
VDETLTPSEQSRRRGAQAHRLRAWHLAVIAAAVVVAMGAWLAVHSGNSGSTARTNAVLISPRGLRTLAGSLRQPIYWVGPTTSGAYELTRPTNGRILFRYLPPGAEAGASKPYLTIGTYPLSDAYGATQRAANGAGAVRISVGGGAIAFYNEAHPLSAFISYPDSSYQIEVFDPSPGRARELVASGKVNPVPGSPAERTRPFAVSARALTKLALAAHQPIYWAGVEPNYTYELTQTSQRWFLVRYLPPGVEVGAGKPYLTVATYPVTNAFAAVGRLARAKDAVSINLSGGGLAVVNAHFPKSIYLAYPGSNYQVEVFDPSLARARQLVSSERIAAVK